MVDFDHSPWRNIHADLSLYRFEGTSRHPVLATGLVLMLHGPMTSHRTWDVMADGLWQAGFEHIYAIDMPEVQMGGGLRHAVYHLENVIRWLAETYPTAPPLIIIGHSTGGVLARRIMLKSQDLAMQVAFLFTLASPHSRTHFSYQVYVPPEEDTSETNSGPITSSLVKTPEIPRDTFLVNLMGNAVGPFFDGSVRGVFLPEGVNLVLPLGHTALKHDPSVINEILACLRGERYRIQFFLKEMLMRTPDQGDWVGPFYFEVNGMRSPYTGIFQALVNHHYVFDENSTPLATLSHSLDQSLASTVFRLKDLSKARPVRRRLFAKLLDSLGNNLTAIHEMQDNEGSSIVLRVHTQRMPAIIKSE